MSTLTVLGSGSKGNAIALAADGAVLLIDAGLARASWRARRGRRVDLRRSAASR
jgi:hypothetical protein